MIVYCRKDTPVVAIKNKQLLPAALINPTQLQATKKERKTVQFLEKEGYSKR